MVNMCKLYLKFCNISLTYEPYLKLMLSLDSSINGLHLVVLLYTYNSNIRKYQNNSNYIQVKLLKLMLDFKFPIHNIACLDKAS